MVILIAAKVVSTKRIVWSRTTGETCHIVMDHKREFPYWKGQSWGCCSSWCSRKEWKSKKTRCQTLYHSFNSLWWRHDWENGSLYVCRATYWCSELKTDNTTKKEIYVNFLCDTRAGDMLNLTGPVGKVMLLPQEDTTKKYIMVGTGADITPYLEFICRLFTEDTPVSKTYKGEVWRVANNDVLLYDDEF